MFTVKYNGKKGKQYALKESADSVVVRTHSRSPISICNLSKESRLLVDRSEIVASFVAAGVDVIRCTVQKGVRELRDEIRKKLNHEADVQFAGKVLLDPKSKAPVLYTENFFVKFHNQVAERTCKRLLKQYGLAIKRQLEYVRNAFFIGAPTGTGKKVFAIAAELLNDKTVEFCHPELVREVRKRGAFPQQWHLKKTRINGQLINASSQVESAWSLSQGEGITIAVIDDGVDISHEEFASSGKIIAPRDVTRRSNNPRPGSGDNHGTACAGVACANGLHGASGVAPRANLLPIRLVSGLGSQAEADAFIWAAQHGADVIACSWGPPDGSWWDANDPRHHQVVPLPDSTRLAIDWAVDNGRNGKGCVITWASGNGNESVDNDGYTSYDKVITVAACNDSNRRSAYSDYGNAVWCAFPSNDGGPAKTPGIWTTDRPGADGYNPGNPARGDATGNYTNDFGGTSSACPGAAGVAALVLARSPSLRWDEVKDILKHCCEKIDSTNGNYDANGHSPYYGFGRLNAQKAVHLAAPSRPGYTAIYTAVRDVPIKDKKTVSLSLKVGDDKPIQALKVAVDIEHTYVADLIIRIKPPAAGGRQTVILHNRSGGGSDNLKKTYDRVNTPDLANLLGMNPKGKWTLQVQDKATQDIGRIVSFALELSY